MIIGIGANGASGLLLLALKGGVILSVTALAACGLRYASAAARHSVWFLGMVGLLILPVAAVTAPRWVVAVPASMSGMLPNDVVEPLRSFGSEGATTGGLIVSSSIPDLSSSLIDGESDAQVDAPRPRVRIPEVMRVALLVWIGGAALLLLTFVTGLLTLAYLHRRSPAFPEGRGTELARTLANGMGVRSAVPILCGRPGVMPMSWDSSEE